VNRNTVYAGIGGRDTQMYPRVTSTPLELCKQRGRCLDPDLWERRPTRSFYFVAGRDIISLPDGLDTTWKQQFLWINH
jgi:hypothetical protein